MKNILLGFLMATCMFLLIGATGESSENGRYQAWNETDEEKDTFMLDTKTGHYFRLHRNNQVGSKWIRNSASENWLLD